jgi:hypothetical protein
MLIVIALMNSSKGKDNKNRVIEAMTNRVCYLRSGKVSFPGRPILERHARGVMVRLVPGFRVW